jgi:outer membrane receptor protein involved in Fe transport
MVSTAGLTFLGPDAIIPIDRALNNFRYAAQLRAVRGRHTFTLGGQLLRRQMNGTEEDAHRGYFSFVSDFGNDGITNLRLGRPSQHIKAIGNVTRGFRNWESALYAGDSWHASQGVTVTAALRYQAISRPYEVNDINTIPFSSDRNNWAPTLGLTGRLPGRWGHLS